MAEKNSIEIKYIVVDEQEQIIDFNLFGVTTPFIPKLIKALTNEFFIRSNKVSFSVERAEYKEKAWGLLEFET